MATESGLLVNSHFLHSAGHFICTILDVKCCYVMMYHCFYCKPHSASSIVVKSITPHSTTSSCGAGALSPLSSGPGPSKGTRHWCLSKPLVVMTRPHSHRAKWAWNWDSGTPGLNQSSNSQRISLVDTGVFGGGANLGRITGKGLTIFVIEAGGQTLTILFLSVRLALGRWGRWCKTCGRVTRDGRWSLNKTVTNMYSSSALSLASQRIVLTRNIPMAEYMLNRH